MGFGIVPAFERPRAPTRCGPPHRACRAEMSRSKVSAVIGVDRHMDAPAGSSSTTPSTAQGRPLSLKQRLAKFCLWTVGWEVAGEFPPVQKFVLIAAPHTSNWDLALMLLISTVMGFRVSWIGKNTLFYWPQGMLLRALGGVSVDRSKSHDVVKLMAEEFRKRDSFILAVPPEGTRSASPYWKSGFYFIAKGAGVPICLGFLDYGRKRGGLGPLVMPSDDIRADMDTMRAFYADKTGRYPAGKGPVRLAAEDKPQ
jgi:1-acyl-sn-glycerol-3-phosphate acyltransferase